MKARKPLFSFGAPAALLVTLLHLVCAPPCTAASGSPAAAATKAAATKAAATKAAATKAASANAASAKVASAEAKPDAGADLAGTAVEEPPIPDQYGMSAEYGYAYDPRENISFVLARVFAIYDYGAVWRQARSRSVRFKVEGAVGSTLTPANDLMASVNMLAAYYPRRFETRSLRPYLEAGIGAIYTQFRVKGQGLHFNFNPLLGVGCELPQENGKNPFAAIRAHHLSNGSLFNDNRGVSSVELQIGRYF